MKTRFKEEQINWVQNLIKYNNYLTKKNIGKRISLVKKPKVTVSEIFQNRNTSLETNLARNHFK